MIKIRITLESKEDVIREILVNPENNLEYLHQSIIKNLKLDEFEMASFYITDSNLDLGEEIPLFDTSEKDGDVITMKNMPISSVLYSKDSKLIYIYDFMNMWRFFVEYLESSEEITEKCTRKLGEIPEEAPEKEFVAENLGDDFDDEFEDEFKSEFESLDDIDLDNY